MNDVEAQRTNDRNTRSILRNQKRYAACAAVLSTIVLVAACSGGASDGSGDGDGQGGSGSEQGSGSASNAGAGGSSSGNGGKSSGNGGTGMTGNGGFVDIGMGSMMGAGGEADGGFQACEGLVVAGEQVVERSPLDIYLVFDRTASMGQDCAFTPGTSPPVNSKACFATYAMAQYLMGVDPADETRLAFQFMSLSNNDCDGTLYSTPLVDMSPLPVTADSAVVKAISNETFKGGFGTHIEGALRGLSAYTTAHDKNVGKPAGRTTIGVLMTDGDPNGCDENIDNLAKIVENHLTATSGAVKMFFIGETGATLSSLEKYAVKGGAALHTDFCGTGGPSPCHYWDVGNGEPAALASALKSIVSQATTEHPIPCTFEVPPPPKGETFDPSKVNVQFSMQDGKPADLFQVDSKSKCDGSAGGWFYDDPEKASEILLCDKSCKDITAAKGATVSVQFGCESRKQPIR